MLQKRMIRVMWRCRVSAAAEMANHTRTHRFRGAYRFMAQPDDAE